MKSGFLFIAILLFESTVFSQVIPCGTEISKEYAENMKKNMSAFEEFNMSFQKDRSATGRISSVLKTNSIPIKIHVVRNNSGFTSLDTANIRKGINYMNKLFLNSGLEFYICGAYNYINNSTYYNLNNTEYTPLNNAYGVANVINMFFADTLTSGGANILGIAPTPGGGLWIMIKNNADTTVYAHEMGHFFGLLHTHGYSNNVGTTEFVDGSNCHEAGDYFCDTPADPQLMPNVLNNPMVNTQCQYFAMLKDGHNQLYTPDVSNIMSYAPHKCVSHFSNDQLAYMNWVYINRRSNLTCSSINVNFNTTTVMSCDSPYVYQFQNQSVGVSNYQWDVNDDGTTDYTTTNPTHTYTSGGVKWVTLSATSGGKTYTRYKPIEFIVPNKVPKLTDFNSNSLLPNGWKLYNPDLGRSWELTTVIGMDGQNSNALRFRNYNYTGYEEQDAVITNAYDLRNFKNARLTFDVAYAPHNKTDTLFVYASTDCGNSYPFLIQKLYGSTLQTRNKQFQEFIPNENDWKNVLISLNAYVNNFVSFKIVNYNRSGNNIYIDNIRVEGGDSTLNEIGFARTLINTSESSTGGQTACRGYRIIAVPVFISAAPTSTITVNVTSSGTAANLHDYELMNNQVVFPAGQTANKLVNVKVYDDAASEAVENIVLSLAIQGNTTFKTTNKNRTSSISVFDNDPVNPEQKVFSSVLLNENFNVMTSDTPAGWTITNTNPLSYTQWMSSSFQGGWLYDDVSLTQMVSADSTNYMMVPTGYSGYSTETTYLITPSFNVSAFDSVSIEFDHVLRPYMPYNGNIVVEVWNGIAWINKYLHTTLQGKIGDIYMPEHLSITTTGYSNTDFKVRFGVVNETDGSFYILDNVKITGFKTKARIATALNSTATGYLGPSQLVNFYDNTTGNIIASIQNQSSWNYGCTTVTIDRAGIGALPYMETNPAYYATQKTILITPEFNNPNGIYDISLYYNSDEINGWLNSTNNNIANLDIVKTGGHVYNISPANPAANGASNYTASNVTNQLYLSNDFKINGSFSQGFSGFTGVRTTSNNLLPIALINPLRAANIPNKGNEITWTTAQEFNCDLFELQRSTDAINFEVIAHLKGQGNTQSIHDYYFMDKAYSFEKNYYRFKQIDYDGQYSLSNIVMVNNREEEKDKLTLFPNPAQHLITITTLNRPTSISILNAFGEEVTIIDDPILPNQIDINTFSKGVYFVRVKYKQEVQTKSFIKE